MMKHPDTSFTDEQPEPTLDIEAMAQAVESLKTRMFIDVNNACPRTYVNDEGNKEPAMFLVKPEVTGLRLDLVLVHPDNEQLLKQSTHWFIKFIIPSRDDWRQAWVGRLDRLLGNPLPMRFYDRS